MSLQSNFDIVTLNVFWPIVIVQFPVEPAKTCPFCAPKLQTFRLLELYVVRGSAVRSSGHLQ